MAHKVLYKGRVYLETGVTKALTKGVVLLETSGGGVITHTGTGVLQAQPATLAGIAGFPPTIGVIGLSQTLSEGDTVTWFDGYAWFNLNGGTAVITSIEDAAPDGLIFYTGQPELPANNFSGFEGTLSSSSSGDYNITIRCTTEFGSVDTSSTPWHIADVITGTGTLQSEIAVASGAGTLGHVITGSIQSEVSTVSGDGEVGDVVSGTGILQSSVATVVSTGGIAPRLANITALSEATVGDTLNGGENFMSWSNADSLGNVNVLPDGIVFNTIGAIISHISGTINAGAAGVYTVQHYATNTYGTTYSQYTLTVYDRITGTGSLQSEVSTVSGSGQVGNDISGSGSLQAQTATASGAGVLGHTGTGSLQSEVSTVSGSGQVGNDISGSGSLQAQTATASGAGVLGHTGTGSLQSEVSTVSGIGTKGRTGSGSLQSEDATVIGSGFYGDIIGGAGILQSGDSTASGAGVTGRTGIGVLRSQESTVTAIGSRGITGAGTLQAQPAIISGVGARVVTGTGVILAQTAVMSGSGDVVNPGQNFEQVEFELGVSQELSVSLNVTRVRSQSS